VWSSASVFAKDQDRQAQLRLADELCITIADGAPLARDWSFKWLCPSQAAAKVDLLPSGATLHWELYGLVSRNLAGEEIWTNRSILLARSESVVARKTETAWLPFNASTSTGLRQLWVDFFTHHGKSHLSTQFDYFRDETNGQGAWATNATMVLWVCTAGARASCHVAFVKPTVILLEPVIPRGARLYTTMLQWRTLLHHAGTAMVAYCLLLQVSSLIPSVRVGLSLAVFALMVPLYAMEDTLWGVCLVALWGGALLTYRNNVYTFILFVVHVGGWLWAVTQPPSALY